jgi:hypothetical protein
LFGVFSVIFYGEAIRSQDIPHSFTLHPIPSTYDGENSHVGALTFYPILFLFLGVRFQVSVFSAAAGLKNGQSNHHEAVRFWGSFIRGYAIAFTFPDT